MDKFWRLIHETSAGFFLGIAIGFFTTFWIGVVTDRAEWERATIERGLSQYCPLDGRWAWKGECND